MLSAVALKRPAELAQSTLQLATFHASNVHVCVYDRNRRLPFGGARASGTNEKARSYLNLIRWVSPRSVKETFVPSTDYRYPFMQG